MLVSNFNRLLVFVGVLLLIVSCQNESDRKTISGAVVEAATPPTHPYTEEQFDSIVLGELPNGKGPDSEYEQIYVVVIDTSTEYYKLQQQMYLLRSKAGIVVDTMNRYYSESERKIILREDDEDEMYRGDYYPRRGTGTSLSIEHYTLYSANEVVADEMALIAGIYDSYSSADSVLKLLQPYKMNAFISVTEMYMGCLH